LCHPKSTKNSGLHKFISPILSDVKKFTAFNGMIILQIVEMGDILAENFFCGMAISN